MMKISNNLIQNIYFKSNIFKKTKNKNQINHFVNQKNKIEYNKPIISSKLSNLTPLEKKAYFFTKKCFEGIYRKNPLKKIPYFDHCEFVGNKLKEAGFSENVVAAGYLHDTVEDINEVSYSTIENLFNKKVSSLVYYVSHKPNVKSWDKKQEYYRNKIKHAPVEAKAISAYDKIYNMNADIDNINSGYDIFAKLGAPKEKQLEKHKLLLEMYDNLSPVITKEYKETLDKYEQKILNS